MSHSNTHSNAQSKTANQHKPLTSWQGRASVLTASQITDILSKDKWVCVREEVYKQTGKKQYKRLCIEARESQTVTFTQPDKSQVVRGFKPRFHVHIPEKDTPVNKE